MKLQTPSAITVISSVLDGLKFYLTAAVPCERLCAEIRYVRPLTDEPSSDSGGQVLK